MVALPDTQATAVSADTTKPPGPFRSVFGYCFSYWRQQPVLIPAMALAMLLATVCDAVIPVFAGELIDALTDQGALAQAIRAVEMITGIGVTYVLSRLVVFALLNRSSTTIMRRMVEDAFFRVQRFSTDWHASSFAGATVRKVTRGMWAYDNMADTVILGFFPAFVVLVSATLLVALRWSLMGGVIAIGVAFYLILSSTLVLRYVAPAGRLANEMDSKLGAALADSISCNQVVKAFAGEEREDSRLSELTAIWRRLTYRTWMRGLNSSGVQNLTVLFLQAIVLSLAVWLWSKGRATPGDVAYLLTTYSVMQGYLREIATHVRNMQRGVNDMEDIARFSLMKLGVEDRPGAHAVTVPHGRIDFVDVTFRYGGQSRAVYEDFSLTIQAGERIGLVGRSGSGKSTFVKLLQRLYDLEAGQILVDGNDIAEITQASLRENISVVPQEPILFHRSLAENIGYGRPGAKPEEIVAAAKRVFAHDFIATLPQGYATEVGERGVKLSGGERQRVALARAVLADAPILIMDEATSSLDSLSEVLMQRAVEAVIEGRTTIIIAHRLSTVRQVDRILVFEAGEIVEQGSHDELIARPGGHYRSLFDAQAFGLVGDVEAAQ